MKRTIFFVSIMATLLSSCGEAGVMTPASKRDKCYRVTAIEGEFDKQSPLCTYHASTDVNYYEISDDVMFNDTIGKYKIGDELVFTPTLVKR